MLLAPQECRSCDITSSSGRLCLEGIPARRQRIMTLSVSTILLSHRVDDSTCCERRRSCRWRVVVVVVVVVTAEACRGGA